MKRFVIAFLLMVTAVPLEAAENMDFNKIAGSIRGHWKSYKITPKDGFPPGMKVPEFYFEITIRDDGTGIIKKTVEGKVIENKTLKYAVSQGALFMFGELEMKTGCPEVFKWALDGEELLIEIAGGGPVTLHMKKVEQGAAGQPATRPESKPEGDLKPQPKSEGRSRKRVASA